MSIPAGSASLTDLKTAMPNPDLRRQIWGALPIPDPRPSRPHHPSPRIPVLPILAMPAPVKSLLAEEWSKDPLVDPTKYPLLPYKRLPFTTDTTIKYAPLVEIDLTHFDEPGETQRLADQLHHADR